MPDFIKIGSIGGVNVSLAASINSATTSAISVIIEPTRQKYNPSWVDDAAPETGLSKTNMDGGGCPGSCHANSIYSLKGFDGFSLSSGDAYNHITGTWVTTTTANYARHFVVPVKVLVSGQIRFYYLAGESAGSGAQVECEYYRPDNNTWTTVANLVQANGTGRSRYAACLDTGSNDDIIIAAGFRSVVVGTDEISRYSISTNSWHTTNKYTGSVFPSFPVSGPVWGSVYIAIWKGRMVAVEVTPPNRIWVFNLYQDSSGWVQQSKTFPVPMNTPQVVQDGPYLYFFGTYPSGVLARRFDIRNFKTDVLNSLAIASSGGWCGICDDGTFLIRQGYNSGGFLDNEVQVGTV